MNDTFEFAFTFFLGVLLGTALGFALMGATTGMDKDTTYVCAPLVSGEPKGQTFTTEDGVTHNCIKV